MPARCRVRCRAFLRSRCLVLPGRPGGPILRRGLVSGAPVSARARQTAVVRRPCGRRRAGQSPSRFKSPGRERVGSRLGSVVRLLCPVPPGFGPLALACPPGSPLCSVVGGPARGVLASRWGGGRFARLFPAAASGCLRRSVPAPSPPRFGWRRLRRRCFSYRGDVAFAASLGSAVRPGRDSA